MVSDHRAALRFKEGVPNNVASEQKDTVGASNKMATHKVEAQELDVPVTDTVPSPTHSLATNH